MYIEIGKDYFLNNSQDEYKLRVIISFQNQKGPIFFFRYEIELGLKFLK
jgi:hypothetical protein